MKQYIKMFFCNNCILNRTCFEFCERIVKEEFEPRKLKMNQLLNEKPRYCIFCDLEIPLGIIISYNCKCGVKYNFNLVCDWAFSFCIGNCEIKVFNIGNVLYFKKIIDQENISFKEKLLFIYE